MYLQCVPQVDAEVLSTLIPKLIELLKSGVGLGTKVTTAQLIISLVRQCMFDLTPYAGKWQLYCVYVHDELCLVLAYANFAGKLLTALLSGLSDRSSSVRKAHAKAIGYLIKVLS